MKKLILKSFYLFAAIALTSLVACDKNKGTDDPDNNVALFELYVLNSDSSYSQIFDGSTINISDIHVSDLGDTQFEFNAKISNLSSENISMATTIIRGYDLATATDEFCIDPICTPSNGAETQTIPFSIKAESDNIFYSHLTNPTVSGTYRVAYEFYLTNDASKKFTVNVNFIYTPAN